MNKRAKRQVNAWVNERMWLRQTRRNLMQRISGYKKQPSKFTMENKPWGSWLLAFIRPERDFFNGLASSIPESIMVVILVDFITFLSIPVWLLSFHHESLELLKPYFVTIVQKGDQHFTVEKTAPCGMELSQPNRALCCAVQALQRLLCASSRATVLPYDSR